MDTCVKTDKSDWPNTLHITYISINMVAIHESRESGTVSGTSDLSDSLENILEYNDIHNT